MSTPSRIGLVHTDGTVTSVRCNWKGDVYDNGRLLLNHYTDEAKLRALLSYGELSVLRERVSPDAAESHSFDTPVKDVCVFYGRDRGEEGVDRPDEYDTVTEFLEADSGYIDYLFKGGVWYLVTEDKENRPKFKKLTQRNTQRKI